MEGLDSTQSSLIPPKQISTPATQNSPWRGWTVPSQGVSLRPSLSGTLPQPHPRWGLMPDFPGPPPDARIDQLDEYSVTSQPQLSTHYHCSFSAMERSLENLMARPSIGLCGSEHLKVSSMISPSWKIASVKLIFRIPSLVLQRQKSSSLKKTAQITY